MGASDKPPVERSDRALFTCIQQELGAPAEAISGYAEILLEEASKIGGAQLREDLEKIDAAGRSLRNLIASLVSPARAPARAPGEDAESYRRRLRHDLRTPINAIKGYGEMLREDAAEDDKAHALLPDLDQLLMEASRLLARIDNVVMFSQPDEMSSDAIITCDQEAAANSTMIAHGLVASVQPIAQSEADDAASLPSRILVVDDNASNRELLKRRLERQGHAVLLAAGGGQALTMTKEAPVDLILLDLMMPDVNGFDVLRTLKQDPVRRDIPVIMISALNEID